MAPCAFKNNYFLKLTIFFSGNKNPALLLWQLDFKASALNARHDWVNEGYISLMLRNYCKLKTGGKKAEMFKRGEMEKLSKKKKKKEDTY